MVSANWAKLGVIFDGVEVDEVVVMPNHLHGILLFHGDEAGQRIGVPLSEIVRRFKGLTTREFGKMALKPGADMWQPNFYEQILRTDRGLSNARRYISNNPLQWELDRNNPEFDPFEGTGGRDARARDAGRGYHYTG